MFLQKIKSLAVAAALVVGGAVAASAPAVADSINDIVNRGKVRIGVLVGAPPFGSVDAQGNPVGYDTDVANLVASYLGVEAELVPLTPPARIPALETNRVDFLVATLAPTPERAKTVLFTIPYSAIEVAIYAPKGTEVGGWDDLEGKTIGITRGSSVEKILMDRGLNLVHFEDDATQVQALAAGQVDTLAIPNPQANAALKARPNLDMEQKFIFSQQPNSMTVRKGDYEMQNWLNNVIYYIKLNGELNAIAEKWIGIPLPELPTF